MITTPKKKCRRPRYSQIKCEIIDKIQNGEYEQGKFLPTLAEVSRHYNVSMITSKRAFAELAELGYLKLQQGRKAVVTIPESLKLSKSIGVVYATGSKNKPSHRHAPWSTTILNAIQNIILSDGNVITLIPEDYRYDLIADNLSGYILIDSHLRPELYDRLRATGKPFVVINPHSLCGIRPNQIALTYNQAGVELAEHFLRGGMSSFGYLVPHEASEHLNENLRLRMETFFKTVNNHGIKTDSFKFVECSFYQHESYMDMRSLLKEGFLEPPFGLISTGDFQAMGACTALLEAGLKPLKDFMLISGTGLEDITRFTPKLSTFIQPLPEIAHHAINLIYDQIRKETTIIPGKGIMVKFVSNET